MNQADYHQIFNPKSRLIRAPKAYNRGGLEVRSYFHFGPHCDPRHELPLSIALWRLPPGEQLR